MRALVSPILDSLPRENTRALLLFSDEPPLDAEDLLETWPGDVFVCANSRARFQDSPWRFIRANIDDDPEICASDILEDIEPLL